MSKQNGAATRSSILRTDRPRPAVLAAAGAAAGAGIAYMATGMPIPTGALSIAVCTALGATSVGLMVSETIAEWRGWTAAPVVPEPVRQGSLRVVAGRTPTAPIGALTCENEVLRDPLERPSPRRARAADAVLSGAAVPAER